MLFDLAVVRSTVPMDIASYLRYHINDLGLDWTSMGSGEGHFYTKTETGERDKYFRVIMKDNVIFFHFYHPDPTPDSSWVNDLTQKYLVFAQERGMKITRIEHLYHYHPKPWASTSDNN